jgi:hypothetical protein
MSSLRDTVSNPNIALNGVEAQHVLAGEAGLPFDMAASSDTEVDPIAEWLSLMEVVQMLCPAWPVRLKPMRGNCWRL